MAANDSMVPLVRRVGITQPLPPGVTLHPRHIPLIVFEDNEFVASMGTDDCGVPIIYIQRGQSAGSCAGCTVMTTAKVPVWCEEGDWSVGSIVFSGGTYFVATQAGVLPDPRFEGVEWSQGFGEYSLAVIHATTL